MNGSLKHRECWTCKYAGEEDTERLDLLPKECLDCTGYPEYSNWIQWKREDHNERR